MQDLTAIWLQRRASWCWRPCTSCRRALRGDGDYHGQHAEVLLNSLLIYTVSTLFCIINLHSRSNHHEFNHSCYWLVSQLNHSILTKISHVKSEKLNKKSGGMPCSPNPFHGRWGGEWGRPFPTPHPIDAFSVSIWALIRRLDSKPPPLRISGYATVVICTANMSIACN